MMRHISRPFGAVILSAVFFVLAAGAFAQAAVGEIVFVDGKGDVSVLRGGKILVLGEPIGFELHEADQVQTGAKTMVELRLKQKGAVVKLSENTVLLLQGLEGGKSSLELLYGRVRSKVEKLTAKESFEIRSASVIAGVRGTDFGCDLIVPRAGATSAATSAAASAAVPAAVSAVRVYCFSGAVEVALAPPSTGAGSEGLAPPPPLIVEAGRMVLVELAASDSGATGPTVLETRPLDEALRKFWSMNEFSSPPPSSSPAFDLRAASAALARKNAALAGGLLLAATGATCGVAALAAGGESPELATWLGVGAALAGVASLPALIFSLSVDPLATGGAPAGGVR